MKRFRSILFWSHLATGVLASVVILVMSGTGVLLALKPQIQDWIERDVRYVTPQSTPRLSPDQLLTAVKEAKAGTAPQSLAVNRDPAKAVLVSLGRDGNVYVNPYTGAVLGFGSARTTQFFQAMTNWHRYMGAAGENRATGKSATGISNLAFLALAMTGLYLWWPKQLTPQYLKPIVWFRRTSTGRAREFNWHTTIGFWCLIPIVVMTASGAVISYPWASNLVYRLSGSPVPPRNGGGPSGPPAVSQDRTRPAPIGNLAADQGRAPRPEGTAREGGARQTGDAARREIGAGESDSDRQGRAIVPAQLDHVWARAEQQVATWSLLSMRLPTREGGPVAFTITDGANWNMFARSNLTLDSSSGDVIQWQPYEGTNMGQKVRGWLRFAHTGELGGLPGQIVAGLGCLGGVFLAYTGLSLSVRRFWNWSLWKRVRPSRRGSAVAVNAVASRVVLGLGFEELQGQRGRFRAEAAEHVGAPEVIH